MELGTFADLLYPAQFVIKLAGLLLVVALAIDIGYQTLKNRLEDLAKR